MQQATILLAITLAAAALAGCADQTTGPTPTTSTPMATTPTAEPTPTTTTVVPTVITPTVTTPTVEPPVTPPGPRVADVTVVAAPERVAVDGEAQICFRVDGAGTVPHVALHYDSEPHPNATAFTDYALGAVYPDNRSAADPAGYALPGTFCAWLPVGGDTLYYRAHVLAAPAAQKMSIEHTLHVGDATGITLVGDVPEVASPGSSVNVCWQVVGGTGVVPHTAIHWDNTSHPDATSFSVYAGGAVYPNNTAAAQNETLPGPFCANLTMPGSGALYFRPHAIQGGNHSLGAQDSILAAPAIALTRAPTSAAHESTALICWRVEGSGTVPHTAVHWDTASHPAATAFSDYKGGAIYPDNATAPAPGGYALPGTFCSGLELAEHETYYLRAHVLAPNVRNELSAEQSIEVVEG